MSSWTPRPEPWSVALATDPGTYENLVGGFVTGGFLRYGSIPNFRTPRLVTPKKSQPGVRVHLFPDDEVAWSLSYLRDTPSGQLDVLSGHGASTRSGFWRTTNGQTSGFMSLNQASTRIERALDRNPSIYGGRVNMIICHCGVNGDGIGLSARLARFDVEVHAPTTKVNSFLQLDPGGMWNVFKDGKLLLKVTKTSSMAQFITSIDLNLLEFKASQVVQNTFIWDSGKQRKVCEYLNLRKGNFLEGVSSSEESLIDGSIIAGSSTLLSDGVWVWPYIISYYVERQAYNLPQEFIDHLDGKNLSRLNFSNRIRYNCGIQRQKKYFALRLSTRKQEFCLTSGLGAYNIKKTHFGEGMAIQTGEHFFDQKYDSSITSSELLGSLESKMIPGDEFWVFDNECRLIGYVYDSRSERILAQKNSYSSLRWFFLPKKLKIPPRPIRNY